MSYRNKSCPVPFFALDTGLVQSMHREIRALHGLLLDAADSLGISPEDTEKAIAHRELALSVSELDADTETDRD